MAKVYSERFLMAFGAGDYEWFVPALKRAVIRSINLCNTSSAAAQALVYGGGVYLYYRDLPGSAAVTPVECRVVLYQAERLAVSLFGPEPNISISGYLFDDPTGGVPRPEQLPALPAEAPFPHPSWGP